MKNFSKIGAGLFATTLLVVALRAEDPKKNELSGVDTAYLTELGYLKPNQDISELICVYLPEEKAIECQITNRIFKIEKIGTKKSALGSTPPQLTYTNYIGDFISKSPEAGNLGSGKRTVLCNGECKERIVTEKTQNVVIGETFTITLPVQGGVLGQGSWEKFGEINDEGVISYLSKIQESPKMPGEKGFEEYKFKALKAGRALLVFKRGTEHYIVEVSVSEK